MQQRMYAYIYIFDCHKNFRIKLFNESHADLEMFKSRELSEIMTGEPKI